eukprot:g674.t1
MPKMLTVGCALAGTLRLLLSGLFLAGWVRVHEDADDIAAQYVSWLADVLLPSFALTCCARFAVECRRGHGTGAGLRECWREAEGVASDLCAPVLAVLGSARNTWRGAYEETLEALARLGIYLQGYGVIGDSSRAIFLAGPYLLYKAAIRCQRAPPSLALLFLAAVFLWWQLYQIVAHALLHRFFSHRAFRASRPVTLLLGLLSCIVGQRGPLWWASTHRRHHKHCETALDPHCPGRQGFWYAHVLWILDRDNFAIRLPYVRDWLRHNPELLLVDACRELVLSNWHAAVPAAATSLVLERWLGCADIAAHWPHFGAHASLLGLSLSLHFTYLVNSWTHSWAKPRGGDGAAAAAPAQVTARPETDAEVTAELIKLDVHGHKQAAQERPCRGIDVAWVGLLNGGDGFHGRHHAAANLAQQAPHWWQDSVYMTICVLERAGVVHGVQREGSEKWKER